jgi:hypothetical protein
MKRPSEAAAVPVPYSLRELALYLLRLGTFGFGGLIGYLVAGLTGAAVAALATFLPVVDRGRGRRRPPHLGRRVRMKGSVVTRANAPPDIYYTT